MIGCISGSPVGKTAIGLTEGCITIIVIYSTRCTVWLTDSMEGDGIASYTISFRKGDSHIGVHAYTFTPLEISWSIRIEF